MVAIVSGCLATLFAGHAGATVRDSALLPVAYVQRPLTLPAITLVPQLSFHAVHTQLFGAPTVNGLGPVSSTMLLLPELGIRVGLHDDFSFEVLPLSLVFGPDISTDYGAARLNMTYGFYSRRHAALGARLGLFLDNSANGAVSLAVPVRVRGGDVVRFDTAPTLGVFIPDDDDVTVGLATAGIFGFEPGLPLELAAQVTDPIAIGFSTGFGVSDFTEPGDTVFVPLGVHVVVTIPDGKGAWAAAPVADIIARFSFPKFISRFGDDTIVTNFWTVGLTGRTFIGR